MTSLCKRTLASYLPSLFTKPPKTVMNFLSISVPDFAIASATSALLTDPKSLSPVPTLAFILISKAFIASAIPCASLIIFSSL